MNSGVIIDEYYDKYEVTKVIFDNKIEQMEFASLIYEFVTSDYFLEDKPLYYLGSPIRCSKENEYPEIFQRLTPLFNQITVWLINNPKNKLLIL